ncbi:MAG: hypothetical protein LQ341_005353 [Variospora aurantia]|nr:MAG: hypothetical protein LQ341_005353 [Variospora aurantia]
MSEKSSSISIAANQFSSLDDLVEILNQLISGEHTLMAYAARTYIRTFVVKQFLVEDALLLLAVVCLCGSTALAFSNMHSLYNILAVILHGPDLGQLVDTLNQIPEVSKRNNAASTLWWCVIYPVKLAFLFFFRRLIVRLPKLYMWWWLALPITVLAWAGALIAETSPPVMAKADEKTNAACSGSAGESRVIRDTAATTAVDVITDIIVLSFPVVLLWEVRVDVRQKFALGISLCLSIVMIVVAIVRISVSRLANGEVDIVWLAFWQQQESSIAVIVVSVSAFRSLFVSASMNRPVRKPLRQSVNDWRRRIEIRRLGPTTNEQELPVADTLPQVPSPTLTGMSSLVRRQ